MSKHEAPAVQREPARIIAVIVAFVTAVLTAAVAFGVEVTPDQRDAVLGVVVALAALVPLVQGELTRRKVFSPATVAEIEDEAVERGVHLQADGERVLRGRHEAERAGPE